MGKVALNKPAPGFELNDYNGDSARLADYHGYSISDIPENDEILAILREVNREE